MTPANIHVGAGTLTLNPDSSPISIESTQDGATLAYSGELEPINVDQVLAPVGYYIPGEECTFETLVTEGTAANLRYALGATDQSVPSEVAATATTNGYYEIKFGGNSTLTDYVLEYKAKRRNNADLYVILRLYIVNISPNLEFAFKKDGVSVYKLTFKAAADTTKDAGQQLGYYRQEHEEATNGTAVLAVSSTTPADAFEGAAPTSIAIVFNRNVLPSSVIGGNFVLLDDAGDEVATTVAFTGDAGTNVTVTPDSALGVDQYYLVISQNVRALDDKTDMAADHIIEFEATS